MQVIKSDGSSIDLVHETIVNHMKVHLTGRLHESIMKKVVADTKPQVHDKTRFLMELLVR